MRILTIHNFYQYPGGEDMVFTTEKELLACKGHEIITYIRYNNDVKGIRIISTVANTLWSQKSKNELKKILLKQKPDICHFHNTFLSISPSAYYACRELKIPVVQTLHNFRLLCPSAILFCHGQICKKCYNKKVTWPAIINKCWQNSYLKTSVVTAMLLVHRILKTWQYEVDQFIALSQFSKDLFIEGGLPPEKITVKPNFVYPDPGFMNKKRKIALFVGRLSYEKGLEVLFKVSQYLKDIPIWIAGIGPLKEKLFRYKSLHNLNNIKFLDNKSHEEIIDLMRHAKFLILPSECFENFPMVIIEAFATGTPVIASRLGVMQEIIQDEKTGLLFNQGDAQDLAIKMKTAWLNPKKTREMGESARKEFEDKYTPDKNYQKLFDIYQKVLNGYKK